MPNENEVKNDEPEGKPFYDKNGNVIPADHFENEASYVPLKLGDEEKADFDAETEKLLKDWKESK